MNDEKKNEIEFHPGFKTDLEELKSGVLRGKEKNFRSQFNRVLTHLEEFSPEEIVKVDGHEILKKVDISCYSLHLQGKGFNIRFLVKYKYERYVLLVAFNEIGGKKATSSYKKNIPKMIERFIDWEENKK